MRHRLALIALAAAVSGSPGVAAAPPAGLAADLRRILAICHMAEAKRMEALAANLASAPERERDLPEVHGAYGRIAIATGDKPCALSFDLSSGSMRDVVGIVQAWVKSRDGGATFRDPRVQGGHKAIWALRRSTLKLDFPAGPYRGNLVVTHFPRD